MGEGAEGGTHKMRREDKEAFLQGERRVVVLMLTFSVGLHRCHISSLIMPACMSTEKTTRIDTSVT